MVTVRKLAQISGVSIATVSLALRNDTRISPTTRQRIQDLAALYHYRPNRYIQGGLGKRRGVIGCLVPSIALEYLSRLLCGIFAYANEQQCRVIVLETAGCMERFLLGLDALIEQRVDGIIIYSGLDLPIPLHAILTLRSHGIWPVLIDDTKAAIALDTVLSDERQMAELVVSYLLALGHRRLGFLGIPSRRTDAMTAVFRSHHVPTDHIVTFHRSEFTDFVTKQIDPLFALCYDRQPRCTAWITLNDMLAAHLTRHASHAGVSIPHEFSVIGYSNQELSEFLTPSLTTVEQHPESIGRTACELLLHRIDEMPDFEQFTPVSRVIPAELCVRDSCRMVDETPYTTYAS